MAWTTPRTYVAGETLTAAIMNVDVRDNWNAAFPVGSLHWRMQAATTAETPIDGFVLECNAVSVLRATYAALNTKLSGLSYPFGSVDGTHMTLPDLQGRTMYAMASGGHADVNALGDSDGYSKTTRTPIHNSTENLTNSGGPYVDGSTAVGVTAGATQTSRVDSTSTPTIGGTIGPGGTRPIDTGPFLVVGVVGVKY